MAEWPAVWLELNSLRHNIHTFIDEADKNKHIQTDKGSLIQTNAVTHFTLAHEMKEKKSKETNEEEETKDNHQMAIRGRHQQLHTNEIAH